MRSARRRARSVRPSACRSQPRAARPPIAADWPRPTEREPPRARKGESRRPCPSTPVPPRGPQADGWWLEDLWVEPAWMGRGVGSRLFGHAAAHARSAGANRLQWEAEPHAVGFYKQMGGRYVRDGEPSAWGRIIPVMGIDLGD